MTTIKKYADNYNMKLEDSPKGYRYIGFRSLAVLRICRLLWHKQMSIAQLRSIYSDEDLYAAIEDGLIALQRGVGPVLTDRGRQCYQAAREWGKGSVGWVGRRPPPPEVRKRVAAQIQETRRRKAEENGGYTPQDRKPVDHWEWQYHPKEPGHQGFMENIAVIYADGTFKIWNYQDPGFDGAVSRMNRWKRVHQAEYEQNGPPKVAARWEISYSEGTLISGNHPMTAITAYYLDGSSQTWLRDDPNWDALESKARYWMRHHDTELL